MVGVRSVRNDTDTHDLRVGNPRQNGAFPGTNLGDGSSEQDVSPGSRRELDARWLEFVVHLNEQVSEQDDEQPALTIEHNL